MLIKINFPARVGGQLMPQGSRPLSTPLWVVTRIDDEALEHYRGIGCFTPAEDREPLTVEIVQRDDLSPDGDSAPVRRNPAQIRMSGIRLSASEARRLIRLLNSAVQQMDNPLQQDLPRESRSYSFNGGYGLAPVSPASRVRSQRRSA
jgi:hypothetical protein